MRLRCPPKILVSLLSPALVACASGSFAQPSTPITLRVDATEAARHILRAKLTIPARPGPLTLLYPKWIPGEHGPTGPIVNLAGLKLGAGGKPLAWRRDSVDLFAFRCDVPAGATAVDVELDYLATTATDGFSAGASSTAQLVDLSWNQLLLYPEDGSPDAWMVDASVQLPAGWRYGTALVSTARAVAPGAGASGATVAFERVSLSTLIDSPLIAGSHFRVVPLPAGDGPAHEIDFVSDSEAALELSPELTASYQAMVVEAGALFGARHYRSYHFLYTLSDHVASFGLEHHESSDNRDAERTLLDETRRKHGATLLPHEFVHSWNGKYRRPAGLATGDYQHPMKGDLLWIYEGLTEYLGEVLTARSGLWSTADFLDDLALTAASLDNRPGRTWRSLEDTAISGQLLYGAPGEWDTWRRGVDFYPEGILLWLDADVQLRALTGGKRSLDDFCRAFFGGESGPPAVKPYDLDDVVRVLAEVAPFDWKAFLTARVTSTGARAPLGGLTGGGYRLAFDETASEGYRANESLGHRVAMPYSLGLWVRDDGGLADVVPGSPAAVAGLAPGMKLVAVNGRRWSAETLHDAVKAGKKDPARLALLVENGEFFRTYAIDYHGGERYPHLERDPTRADVLAAILKPRVARPTPALPPPAPGTPAPAGPAPPVATAGPTPAGEPRPSTTP